jgi:hypothetical protein
MPYRFEFDRVHRILRASVEGALGDEEIGQFRADTAKLVGEAQPSGCIIDLSQTGPYDISSANIRLIGKSAPAVPGISILVIVVAPATHMFGLTRMFQITSEETRPWLRVVKSPQEAYELLRVRSPSFEPVPEDAEVRRKMWAIPRTDR